MGLGDRVTRRLELAAKRNAAVFDEETQQWRYPDDDLSTGYRVAEGVSWLGSVGIIAGAVIAFVAGWSAATAASSLALTVRPAV